ncbi:phospholipase A2 inhibitor alpha-like protein [Varanus komodoensis]|nr:phospholipase A2 inhibitor alpha-like protein [Varanus komodoensis]
MYRFLALGFLLAIAVATLPGKADDALAELSKRLEKLEGVVTDMKAEMIRTKNAFRSVQNARTFATGSKNLFTTNKMKGDFETVDSICSHAGGQVPSPQNEADNKALQSVVERNNEQAFVHYQGSSYTNWADGEPSNADRTKNCAVINQSGKWHAATCQEEHLAVCEFPDF